MTTTTLGQSARQHAEAALLNYWTQVGYSADTIKQRLGRLQALPVDNYGDTTTADVLASLPEGSKPSTRRVYVSSLSAAFRDLITLGFMNRNPAAGIRIPGFHRAQPRPLPMPALQALLAAEPCRQQEWTILGAFAGLRAGEVADVYAADLVPYGAGWGLQVVGKGSKPAVIPAHPKVVELMQAHSNQRGPLWRLTSNTLSTLWAGWAAGITGDTYQFHQLRHRFATSIYQQSGQDLITTRNLLRHNSVVSTQIYADVESDRELQAVAGL